MIGDFVVVLYLLNEVADNDDLVFEKAVSPEQPDVGVGRINIILECPWVSVLLLLIEDCADTGRRIVQDEVLAKARLFAVDCLGNDTQLSQVSEVNFVRHIRVRLSATYLLDWVSVKLDSLIWRRVAALEHLEGHWDEMALLPRWLAAIVSKLIA